MRCPPPPARIELGCVHQTKNRSHPKAHVSGNSTHTSSLRSQVGNSLYFRGVSFLHWPATEPPAFFSRSGETSQDPLTDHGPLKLGEHSHHLKHRTPRRRRRV